MGALFALKFVRDGWQGVGDFIGGVWNGIRDFFTSTPLAPIFAWMVEGIKTVFSPLSDWFTDFWGTLSEKFRDFVGWMTGILDKVNEFFGRNTEELQRIKAELKTELNIESQTAAVQTESLPKIELDDVSVEIPNVPTVEIGTPAIPQMDTPSIPEIASQIHQTHPCLLYTSPSPRDS